MAKLEITAHERNALRGAAHALRPVVLVGEHGLSEPVLKEIDLNLTAHQLIKIRIGGEERAQRDAMLETICDSLSCAPVHHLGKTLIIYRPGAKPLKSQDAEQGMSARRKASEPHTPKKQAAHGIKRTRRMEKAERAQKRVRRNEAAKTQPRPVGTSRSAGPDTPPPGSRPRRARSALSLRAGARNPVNGRGFRR